MAIEVKESATGVIEVTAVTVAIEGTEEREGDLARRTIGTAAASQTRTPLAATFGHEKERIDIVDATTGTGTGNAVGTADVMTTGVIGIYSMSARGEGRKSEKEVLPRRSERGNLLQI